MTLANDAFRLATPADLPALLKLQSAYYAEDGYPFDEAVARRVWGGLLSDARLGRAWVIEAGATLVGYAVLTLGYSLEYQGRDAFVDEIYVTPSARDRGLGKKALAVMSAACAELGVRALHLEVERDKAGAQALYRLVGFEDNDRFLMTKRIGA